MCDALFSILDARYLMYDALCSIPDARYPVATAESSAPLSPIYFIASSLPSIPSIDASSATLLNPSL